MAYPDLVFNLLQSMAWAITPALPLGSAGTRLPVGVPEKIPDITFFTRPVTPADNITPSPGNTVQQECNRLNGYIRGAEQYHELFGLNPRPIGSFEQVLNHFRTATTPIGRIRFISHGDAAFIFCPMFIGGMWDFGMQRRFLDALKDSDEGGLRFLFRDSTGSPLFTDVVDGIVQKIRARNPAVLVPFGIQATGSAPAGALPYFEIVNDLYQARFGTVIVIPQTGAERFRTTAESTIIIDALNRIETSVRTRIAGTIIGTTTLTATHLTALRDAVLAVEPGPLGMYGGPVNLPAGTVAAVGAATTAGVENDIRMAFTGGAVTEPVFLLDNLSSLINGLERFNAAPLNIGSAAPLTESAINADADLHSLALAGMDMFMLQNGAVVENGAVLNATQRTTLRNGLVALANFARTRITSRPTPPFTAPQLNTLRDALANLEFRKSTILGFKRLSQSRVTDLRRATIAMADNFRVKLDRFRGLIQAGNLSSFDVRGCLVGQSVPFLDSLRAFLGTTANQPRVSAPDWFQSFPAGVDPRAEPSIHSFIDGIVSGGSPPQIRPADVGPSLNTWRGLIDFTPHFDFIVALFAGSKRDFASLRWRVFQTTAAPHGIPVMRMAAKRIDDLDSQDLGNVIERFRAIFEISAATRPNATERGKLTTLKPHLVRFQTLSDSLAAASPPLGQIKTDLTSLVTTRIVPLALTTEAPPAAPAGASQTDVESYRDAISQWLERLLDGVLNPFFTAVQAATATTVTNAAIRYYYNCGLPLLLQNGSEPKTFLVSTYVSPGGSPGSNLLGDAIRSWMRVQWDGNTAQAAAMNARINAVPITDTPQRLAASRVSMLTEHDPDTVPTTPAGIAPMPIFDTHIIKRPP